MALIGASWFHRHMYAMRRQGLFFACLTIGALLTGCAAAGEQGVAPSDSESSLPSAAQLSDALESALEHTGVPGAVVLLTSAEGTESLALCGEASPGVPSSEDSRFAYRSITKSFVGTVILQLADEGKLSLDSPVADFVTGIPGGETITLAELGAMRSGLPNYSAMPGLGELLSADPSRKVPATELLGLAFAEPSEFAPGTAYEYSNTNTLLLGEVIEAVTGKPWPEAVEDRISGPLDLSSVEYGFTDPALDATGFQITGPGTIEELPSVAPEWFGAAGGLTGDIHDLAAWGRELGLGTTLTSETQQERLGTLGTTQDDPQSPIYDRYGFAIGEIEGWVGHTGNGLGFQALVMHHPSDGKTMAILLNGTGEDSDLPAAIFKSLLELL